MKIPIDAVIPREKITEYLLRHRENDDKSRFLLRLGFSIDDPEMLEAAIRRHASEAEAVLDAQDVYGDHFVLTAPLIGPGAARLIRSVWIRRAGESGVRLVTLYPAKEQP